MAITQLSAAIPLARGYFSLGKLFLLDYFTLTSSSCFITRKDFYWSLGKQFFFPESRCEFLSYSLVSVFISLLFCHTRNQQYTNKYQLCDANKLSANCKIFVKDQIFMYQRLIHLKYCNRQLFKIHMKYIQIIEHSNITIIQDKSRKTKLTSQKRRGKRIKKFIQAH